MSPSLHGYVPTHSLISFWPSQCFFVQQSSSPFYFKQSFLGQYVFMGYLSPNPYTMISAPFNSNKITSDNCSEVNWSQGKNPFSPFYCLTKVNVSNLKFRFLTSRFCSWYAFRKKGNYQPCLYPTETVYDATTSFTLCHSEVQMIVASGKNIMIDCGTVDMNQFFAQY